MEHTMTAVVIARHTAHILRKKAVTTFEEIKALHDLFPRNDIGLFEDPTGVGGDFWTYMAEYDTYNAATRR